MVKYLSLNKESCTGCRQCESVCSMSREGVLNRAKSRIKVFRTDVLQLSQKFCNQCGERQCIAACPEDAIYEKKDQVRVHRELCTGCGRCTTVCDRLFLSPENGWALMCNQCGACVKACPEAALEIKERE
ncbi:MAG: 4Fe-4S binding protein [Spirochaetales bacterium]|nr:4Fe-4S binding protein [Spirochaetales bacterium]